MGLVQEYLRPGAGSRYASARRAFSVSVSISAARHVVHALGPAAYRVGLGECPQRLEQVEPPAKRIDEFASRRRIVDVLCGREPREGQVLAHQHRDVGR